MTSSGAGLGPDATACGSRSQATRMPDPSTGPAQAIEFALHRARGVRDARRVEHYPPRSAVSSGHRAESMRWWAEDTFELVPTGVLPPRDRFADTRHCMARAALSLAIVAIAVASARRAAVVRGALC
jgi:hypothetical protein